MLNIGKTKGKPKDNQRNSKGKPKENHRETKGTSKAKQRKTKVEPQGNQRETKSKILGLQIFIDMADNNHLKSKIFYISLHQKYTFGLVVHKTKRNQK